MYMCIDVRMRMVYVQVYGVWCMDIGVWVRVCMVHLYVYVYVYVYGACVYAYGPIT